MSLDGWLRLTNTISLEQQHAASRREVEQRLAEDRATTPSQPRPIGRPRLALKSTASESGHKHLRDPSADGAEADVEQRPKQKQKRAYSHWLDSDLFPHILQAYRQNGHSARSAVRQLQHSRTLNVNGVFDSLNHSTVQHWFDKETHQLKPRIQQLRENAERYTRIGVAGRPRILDEFPAVEKKMKQELQQMRNEGVAMSLQAIKCIVVAILEQHCFPMGQPRLTVSRSWLQQWTTNELDWTWRACTTSSGKRPIDWQAQATLLAKRVALDMQQHSIHPSLVINADQTGLQLCPGAARTYEKRGAKRVAIAGHGDKRQITCVVSSALSGELLPLQLVFQGKTEACHPPAAADHLAVQQEMHFTHSENHWSNLDTTKDWIRRIVEPWRLRKVAEHNLPMDAHTLLILDVWHVHISAEFRSWLEEDFPRYHLRFIPPNCTADLQVADVALNFPLKHAIKKKFNDYVAKEVAAAMQKPDSAQRAAYLKRMLLMSELKPRLLLWTAQAWQLLSQETILIYKGWKRCLLDFYDVLKEENRKKVAQEAKEQPLDCVGDVPANAVLAAEHNDQAAAESDEEEQDSSEDEKPTRQVMKERIFGERRSSRHRREPQRLGLLLRTDQLQIVPALDDE